MHRRHCNLTNMDMFYVVRLIVQLFIAGTYLLGSVHGQSDFIRHFESLINKTVYNKMERPYYHTDHPVVVQVDFFVSSINAVDEITMDFKINLFLRQRWTDPRLAFDEMAEFNGTVHTINHEYVRSLWTPDIYFRNELTKGSFHDVTVPNILITLSPKGDVLYSQRISTTLGCNMRLEKYPLDNQTCFVEIESYGYMEKDVELKWTEKVKPAEINEKLELPEFNITDYLYEDCTHKYSLGWFSCIRLKIHLNRLKSYYFVQVYVPTILIVCLSWVSFWIDHKAVPARISVGLLTVLTITTKSSSINANLPKVSYVKAIDVWMFTCTVFVFAALIEYSIVNVLARKQTEKEQKQKRLREKMATEIVPPEYKESNDNNKVAIGNPQGSQQKKKKCKLFSSDNAMALEQLSRIVFPSSFIVFNIVYWFVYLL